MKRSSSFLFILSVMLTVACNKGPNLILPVTEVDYLNKSEKMLEGTLVHQDILGAERIIVFDTLLMITRNNPGSQLLVYSTNTLDSLSSLCSKGRARNEFLRLYSTTEQVYYDENNHVVVPFVDLSQMVKEVDITESLNQRHTVIKKTDEIMSFVDGITVFVNNDLSNRFIYEHDIYDGEKDIEDITRVPVRFSLQKDGGKQKPIKVFRRLVEVFNPDYTFMPFDGSLKKSPNNRNVMFYECQYMDYLFFFDLDNGNNHVIHQKGSKTFDDFYDDPGDDFLYFLGYAGSSDYLFTLYYHGDYTLKEKDIMNRCPELMVFDWEGNFIKSFKMDREVFGMGYDEIHKKLFCINTSEDLYVYDLSKDL